MVDTLSRAERSERMSRIKSKDTAAELRLRSLLHRAGFRFRLHDRRLPGTPDIVLPKYQCVVECRGCFFHRHAGCKVASTPKSNRAFWLDKFRKNVARDRRTTRALRRLGWKVMVVWECQLTQEASRQRVLQRIGPKIRGSRTKLATG